MKTLIEKNCNNLDYSFSEKFIEIVFYHSENYGNKSKKENLRMFLENLQNGGCQSGVISDFICHSDCKDFYVENIDDLEDFKSKIEENIGYQIENKQKLPHYTFVVWLCFEEFCYEIYTNIF